MNDDEVITAVREQRDKVHSHTPLEQILSRGRVVRARRRITGAVGGVAVVTAAAVVLGLGLSGALGSAPARSTGTIRTAAFTLTENANGTATLTVTPQVFVDPGTLQSDLRQYGIPAIVTAGRFCFSDPSPPGFTQVVSGPNVVPLPPPTYTINPAAMPAGAELSFGIEQIRYPPGYPPLRPGFQGIATETFMELIATNSYTCSSTPSAHPPGNAIAHPPGNAMGGGASVEYFPGEGWTLISYPAR
jgi:hypothetical protein